MTEIKLHKLFPVPVFEKKLDNYSKLNEEFRKIYSRFKRK